MMLVKDYFIPSTRYDGYSIHVKHKSNNPSTKPLLFLHGLSFAPDLNQPDSIHDGKSAADIMTDMGIDCYIVCALGYGKSGKPPNHTNDFLDWVGDIRDVMDWLNTPVDIMGCSGSAVSALMIAQKFPDKVGKLIIHGLPDTITKQNERYDIPNTHMVFDIDRMKYKRYKDIPEKYYEEVLPTKWYEAWEANIKSQMPFHIPLGTEIDRIKIKMGETCLNDYFIPEKITTDCLFISGIWDTVINRKQFYDIHKRLASTNKSFKLVPKCSHWGLIEKTRMNMINVMVNFLKNVKPEPDTIA